MNFDASFEALVRNSFAAALAAGQPDRITRSAYAALDQQPTAVLRPGGIAASGLRDRGGGVYGLPLQLLVWGRVLSLFRCSCGARSGCVRVSMAVSPTVFGRYASAVELRLLWFVCGASG